MRILVTDGMDKDALQTLKNNGHEVVEQFYAPEELGAALKEFDAVVVRSATKVRANHIDEAKGGKLKLIIRGGVGVDNIDVKYAESRGLVVRNTPRASSDAVAELVLAHMFSVLIGAGTAEADFSGRGKQPASLLHEDIGQLLWKGTLRQC